MSKFTPGPWMLNDFGPTISIGPSRDYCGLIVARDQFTGYEERDGWKKEVRVPFPDADANARLIAAAPDLLKALDDLLDLAVFMSGSADFSPGGVAYEGWRVLDGVKTLVAARDAISKAEGQASEGGGS